MFLFTLLKNTFTSWNKDKASMFGAALAYFTVFSLSPLLLVVISLVGLFFGHASTQKQILDQLSGFLGSDTAKTIATMLKHSNKPSTSIISSIIGIVTLLLGATGVFGQLKEALNFMWHVEKKPSAGIWGMIHDKILSFSMLLVIGFLLIVSLIASSALSAVGTFMQGILPFPAFILEIINFIISFGVITVLFALIYKYLPDVLTPWKYAWGGAVIAALLFTIGKTVIGIYIGHSGLTSTYGSSASIIVILLWVYYSVQILFFGAEFVKNYAVATRERIVPVKDAAFTNQSIVKPEKKVVTKKQDLTEKQIFAYMFAGFIIDMLQRVFRKHPSSVKYS